MAQQSNFQQVTTKCYTGPTLSFGNTTGTLVGSLNFVAGVDIPLNHKVVDVIVEVHWSKTDVGSCVGPTGVTTDLSHVGFQIRGPIGGNRYLAASATTGAFALPTTTASFSGGANILQDTTVFRDGHPSLLPASLPVLGRDTVAPNNDKLSFYTGAAPYGVWSIMAIDDAPMAGPQLCLHSYCITLVTCEATQLQASCKANPSVSLDANGIHLLEFSDLDSMSEVSCLVKNISFSPSLVNCSNIGTAVPVFMTIRDRLDSVSTCLSMVRVLDTDRPMISNCFPAVWGVRYLDNLGKDTLWADSIDFIDNCMPVVKSIRPFWGTTWQSSMVFSCVSGFQQFWVRGIDGSGNQDSCRLIVNFMDTVAPNAICGQYTAVLTTANNGAITVSAIDVDGGSYDVCPPVLGRWIGAQFAAPPVYTCADVGIDTVRLIVSDIAGNLDTCDNAIITIIDNSPPKAIHQNDTIYLDASGNGIAYAMDINNGSIDTCGIDSMNIGGAAFLNFNCLHLNSPQTVQLNVFDFSGNMDSCAAIVYVRDTFPPLANCQNRTVYLDGNGNATVSANSLNGSSVDLCTGTFLSFEIGGNPTATFSCADIVSSPNAINVTVLDSFGNASTCVANVTVLDTISPIANCATPTVYLNGSGIAMVYASDLSAGSQDNCMVADSFVNTVGAVLMNYSCGALFSPQLATFIVEDISGNMGSCMATINVEDTIKPRALCKASYTASLNAIGEAVVNIAVIDSNSTDNCGLVEYLINGGASVRYTCADIGTQLATLSVRDSSNNSATCSTTIEVEDKLAPSASCQSYTLYLNNAGLATLNPNNLLVYPGTGDNCGPISASFLTGSTLSFNCDSVGVRQVQVLVTDGAGNSASCMANVTILDTIQPIASCRPVPFNLALNAMGEGCVFPSDVNNGSMDWCSMGSMLVNGQDSFCFDCSNLGTNTVTLTVFDASGNAATCLADVFVQDLFSPQASCKDTVVYLNAFGLGTLLPNMIDDNSIDNCFITTMTVNSQSALSFSCADLGTNTIQLMVYDSAGHSDFCVANVSVVDTIAPQALCSGTDSLYFSGAVLYINAAMIDLGSMDNCAIQSMSLSKDSFDCPDIGDNEVTLLVTDGSGNVDSCTLILWVLDTSATAIAGLEQVLCSSDSTFLSAIPASGSLLGTWTTTSTAFIHSPNLENTLVTNIPPGNHAFYWTLSNATCSNLSMDSVIIRMVPPSPDIALVGDNIHLCMDSVVHLSADSVAVSVASWTQSAAQANTGIIIHDANTPSSFVSGMLPGNVYQFVWELTNSWCGVHASDTILVSIDAVPTDVAMAGLDVLCSPDTIYLAAIMPNQGGGIWTSSSSSHIADPTVFNTMVTNLVQDTSVFVWTLSNGACLDYDQDTVLVLLGAEQPDAQSDSFSLVPDGMTQVIQVVENDLLPANWSISIHTMPTVGTLYDFGNGDFEVDINGATGNQYFVYEICNADCPAICDTAWVSLAVLPVGDCYIPNTFTPNGDGKNDYFVIPCLANIRDEAGLHIFNRWGNVVYHANNYNNNWEGTNENNPLPDGVYFYVLSVDGKLPQSGAVEIKR